ncbi:hypothetical protein IWX90DRAFT_309990 [Phyllosticta citrichinensis]|uniref:4'-phosphopantetheinyl transferase domain-containing protein n=1 Tax=Phyllosticta citrichinensis TaxID=1130410 RepID=A0ABR1XLQ0_9PEZI
MPPRPFPWPLSVGTDICGISRIREVLSNTGWRARAKGLRQHSHGGLSQRAKLRRFLHTLMTYDEILHFLHRFPFVLAVDSRSPTYEVDNKVPSSEWHPTNAHLAGRFAAKEAISKAFGGNVSRHQITILRSMLDSHQQPQAVVHAEPRVMSPQQKLHLHKKFGFQFADLDPQVSLENFDPAPAEAEDLEGQLVKLSISHDGDYATAVCIAPTAAAASPVDAPSRLGDAIGAEATPSLLRERDE